MPLKNAIATAGQSKSSLDLWCDNAIAYMRSSANDIQHANQHTAIFSSSYSDAHGFYINPENLWQAAIIYTVRRIIKPTWLNDRDQFLQPDKPLSDEFKSDCLIWMLFNGSNLTASADGLEWNGKTWSIVNHFIPFTEAEVGSPDRFESDFMVQYLQNLAAPRPPKGGILEYPDTTKQSALSGSSSPLLGGGGAADAVLAEGKKLWQAYFAHTDVKAVREELKLNRADVGWYQVRKALQARNASGDFVPVNFIPFEEAYKALTEKLQPMVYDLGFLKV